MTFKIDSGWLFLGVLLIACMMPVILEVALDYINAYLKVNPSSYFAWIEGAIIYFIKGLTSVLGWLSLFFFAASFFGYKFSMETVDEERKAHKEHVEHLTGKEETK